MNKTKKPPIFGGDKIHWLPKDCKCEIMKHDWIECRHELPECDVPVFLFNEIKGPFIGARVSTDALDWQWAYCHWSPFWDGRKWDVDDPSGDRALVPTHWHPFPKAP